MPDTTSSTRLCSLLQRQLDTVNALGACMDRENMALGKGELAAFETALSQKLVLLAQLETDDGDLKTLLRGHELTSSRAGMEAFIAGHCTDNTRALAQRLWHQLQAALAQCRTRSEINRKVVEVALYQTRHTLNLLTGHSQQPNVYAPSGKTEGGASPQSFGAA